MIEALVLVGEVLDHVVVAERVAETLGVGEVRAPHEPIGR